MTAVTPKARAERISRAVQLARDGMFIDSLEQIRRCGSLRRWTGPDRVQVAWIVAATGAPRLSRWHTLRAYREAPESLAVRNAYGQLISDENGPYDALEFISQSPKPSDDDIAEERLRWLWLQASCLTHLRDFAAVDPLIELMEAVGEQPEFVHFTRTFVLERQDRYTEALESIGRAVQIRPTRGSLGYQAHLLTLIGRDDEAYELLERFDQSKQIASLSWQMSGIAYERRDYPRCARLLERFESLSPLLERSFGEQFSMFRSELARRSGDDKAAIEYARRSKSAYGNKIADRLSDPSRKDRTDKVLPVEFVRQHEMTCGPATLSAISRFWRKPAEHVEVADQICYNGTSNYAERNWANENGFFTREFTVDETITEQLIARDIPFTLVTRGAGYAHLQAVIGYDGRTGTILIRDPFHRVRGTAAADELLESQAAHGPRGMALVPAERSELLDGIDFPDAELYDLLHAFDGALIGHDRDRAIESFGQLRSRAPDHRLRWQAERQLAIYDANEHAMMTPIQKLLEKYPDDVSLQMTELSLLGSLGRVAPRTARLRELVAKPQAHPLLKLQLAESLALDGRYRDEAVKLLREAIRASQSYAQNYQELGDLMWQRRDREAALQLYRFAACLEEKDEYLATRFFDASVAMGRTELAIQWLRGRFDRFGKQSMHPAVTLQRALTRLNRQTEAIDVLESAIALRPDDTELILETASVLAHASSEHWRRAEELLASIRDTAPGRQWHEVASALAVLKGDWKAGLDHLQTILPRSPLSGDLRRRVTDLLAQIEGEDAVIAHWRAASEKFPHCQPLLESYAMALRSRPLEETQPVLEGILEKDPDNAWAMRELAHHLLLAGKLAAAETMIAQAAEIDSDHSFVTILQASLESRRGENESARRRLRGLLEHDISDEFAVSKLLDFCDSVEQQREELNWVLAQLRRQSVTGEVLLVYRDYAETALPEEELLESLREAVSARGDLWQAHQAWIRQLTQMQRLDQASQAADAAIEQFPLEPNAWFEKYRVAAAMGGNQSAQEEALQRCRLLRPANPTIVRALSDLLCDQGKFVEAREMLQTLVALHPLDSVSRAYLADVLMELEQTSEAYEQFEHAVSLEPEYEYAWNRLDEAADPLGKHQARLKLAQRLIEEKPYVVGVWVQYARELGLVERFEEALQALDRAESIDPYREAIHSTRARLLLNTGDFAGAMQALQPSVFPVIPPSLELNRAQILWDVGRQDEAYQLCRATAEAHPSAIGIWNRLEHWAMLRGDRDRAVAAIEHQMRLQPHDPEVLDNAGHAFLGLDDQDRAIDAFSRTIEINPGFSGSRCSLFDLLVEQDRWDEAGEIIRKLPRSDQHPSVIARRMQVSIHECDQQKAEQDFEAILTGEPWSTWAVDQGVRMMIDSGKRGRVIQRVEQALKDPQSNRDYGRLWVQLTLDALGTSLRKRVKTIAEQIQRWVGGEHRDAGHAAISALVPALIQEGNRPFFNKFVKQNEPWIRQDTYCWSVIAYAYAEQPRKTGKAKIRRWINRWQDRDDYQPWMLTNVHELCRIIGDETAGRQAVAQALAMPPDHMQSQLRLWAAHDALFDGNQQLALKQFMGAARLEHLEGLEKLLHHWVEAIIVTQQSTDKAVTFREVREGMSSLGLDQKFFYHNLVYRKVYERTVRMIAESVGTARARWWAKAKIMRLKLGAIGLV